MKAKELRVMNSTELKEELLSLRKTQLALRIQLATQQIENTAQIKLVRRDIARIKTILSENKL